jgi:NADH-quinone oxidoreductase subunit G
MRQAAMMGATVTNINFFESELLMPVTPVIVNTKGLLTTLLGVAKAVISLASDDDKAWVDLLEDVVPSALEQTIAMQLSNAIQATLFIGELANNHPQAANIKALTDLIARLTKSQMIVLPTANSSAGRSG